MCTKTHGECVMNDVQMPCQVCATQGQSHPLPASDTHPQLCPQHSFLGPSGLPTTTVLPHGLDYLDL